MWLLFRKDLTILLSQLSTYLVWGIFHLLCFFFVWWFDDTSILKLGEAEMVTYFTILPYFFIFIIPAFTMRSFAEEFKEGTIQLLLIKPISHFKIVLAKQLAIFALVAVNIMFHLSYVITLYYLAQPVGNVDFQSIAGSFLGLYLLLWLMVSIGIMASSISSQQIFSFILGAFIIYLLYDGPYQFARNIINSKFSIWVEKLSIYNHFEYLSKGVLNLKDLLFIAGLYLIISSITVRQLKKTAS